MPTININGNILVNTVANWTADATVYSAKKILISSNAFYGSTDQRKFKIANGTDTWANLDYFPLDVALAAAAAAQADIDTHEANTSNPHATTLGQAITAGNTVPDGVTITSVDGNVIIDFGSGAYYEVDVTGGGYFYFDSTVFEISNPTKILLDAPIVELPNETPSRIMATDSLGNIDTPYTFSTDGTLSGNSDTTIPSEKAIKSYSDNLLALNDALVFKGVIDASPAPNYPAADKGYTYKISVAGKIGGAAGVVVEIGDTLYCIVDGSPSGNQATVGANWVIVQTNIDGAVIGSAASTDGAIVLYDGTTGKLIKNSTLLPTTLGTALVNFANPGAITFIRINADNSVTARTAAQMLSDLSGQPLDATLTSLAALTIAADSLSIGTGADAFTQVTFAANTFPAKASTGNLVAKTITDVALTLLTKTTTQELIDYISQLTTLGDLPYGGAAGIFSRLAGNTSVWRKHLAQTGDGANSAAPVWINDSLMVVMTNGNQTTTSDSATAITDLIFPVEANSRYEVMLYLHEGCDNTGGVKFAVDIPASASVFVSYQGRSSAATVITSSTNTADATLTAIAFNTFNNANGNVIGSGEIATGATAGNVQLMFASGVAGQTSTIFQQGSFMVIRKV